MSDTTRKDRSTLNRRQLLAALDRRRHGRGHAALACRGGAAAPRPVPAPRRPARAARLAPRSRRPSTARCAATSRTACSRSRACRTARPTGGENRWLPAKPPTPWDGEYPALIYGANCPQRLHDWVQEQIVPLPVDRRLAERGHAEGEHLDAEPDRLAAGDVLHPRRRLLVRLGLRAGVAGRRAAWHGITTWCR